MSTDADVRPLPGNTPARMAAHEANRIRAAAFRAKNLYPGPVGELINRELLTWEEFGFRVGDHSLVRRLVDDVMRQCP